MEVTERSVEFGPFDLFGMTFNPTIHWYGVIIVTGILLATMVVSWLAKKDKQDTDIVWNGLIWVVLAGVIGARLWSVFFPAGDAGEGRELSLDYLTNLDNGPLAIWSGGLSIFGAVLGGAIGVTLYAYRHKLRIWEWIDRVVIAVPLAQAIGRWGNYINQELYGEPTDLPWGIQIDNPLPPYTPDDRFHPLFLYESIWNFLLFLGLFFLWTRRRQILQRGDMLLTYLIGYGIARFLLEFIRVEVPLWNDINVSQAVTGLLVVISVWLLIMRHQTQVLRTENYPPFPGGLEVKIIFPKPEQKAEKTDKQNRSKSKQSAKTRGSINKPKKKTGKSR